MVTKRFNHRYSKADWQCVAEEKREAILSAIPEQWILDRADFEKAGLLTDVTTFVEELLDDETRRITRLNTEQLLGRLVRNSLSAVEVVTAFCKRTAFAHQLVRGESRSLKFMLMPL